MTLDRKELQQTPGHGYTFSHWVDPVLYVSDNHGFLKILLNCLIKNTHNLNYYIF